MLIAQKEANSTRHSGRTGRTGRKGRSRYFQRGFGLVPMLLGLAITSIIVLFASREISNYSFRQRQAEVAEDLHIISKAVHSLVERNPTTFSSMILSEGGRLSYTLDDLKSKNVLIRSFPETNVIGQGYRIYFRAVGANIVGSNIEALVTTVTPAGHPVTYNNVSLLSYGGDNAIGLIQATNPTRLVGPSVDADITPYITRFGKPAVGETVVISHLNTEALIGSYLYRDAIPGINPTKVPKPPQDSEFPPCFS